MYPYEGMILVNPVMHVDDPAGVESAVKALLEKHGAKIHSFEQWDERRLAYEIQGHKRGIYMLTHFEMPGSGVDSFCRETRITECILRQLIIRLETDIPTHLERSARYYETMREEQENRRSDRFGRRDGPPAPSPDAVEQPQAEA